MSYYDDRNYPSYKELGVPTELDKQYEDKMAHEVQGEREEEDEIYG